MPREPLPYVNAPTLLPNGRHLRIHTLPEFLYYAILDVLKIDYLYYRWTLRLIDTLCVLNPEVCLATLCGACVIFLEYFHFEENEKFPKYELLRFVNHFRGKAGKRKISHVEFRKFNLSFLQLYFNLPPEFSLPFLLEDLSDTAAEAKLRSPYLLQSTGTVRRVYPLFPYAENREEEDLEEGEIRVEEPWAQTTTVN